MIDIEEKIDQQLAKTIGRYKPIVYLAGPIDFRTHGEIHNWRELFKYQYGEEYCLDPTRRNHEFANHASIVEDDKLDIDQSDIVVARVDGQLMCGTHMEIMYAYDRNKPVIILNHSVRAYSELSPWIRYHAYAVRNDVLNVIKVIESEL